MEAGRYPSSQGPRYSALISPGVFVRLSVPGIFVVCLALAVVVRYNGLFPSVIDWDVSLYAVMAEQWLRGGLPYETVWDQHSVGLPALFAAILYIFPKSMVALHLSACVAVAATATAVYFIARRFNRGYVAPFAAVALYTAWTARMWGLAGNTEIYINALVSVAMLLLVRAIGGEWRGARSSAELCLGAILLGVALQIKHVAIAETALFFGVAFVLACRGGRTCAIRTFLAAVGCFLLPSVLVVSYFFFEGLASQYFDAVIKANLVYVAHRPSLGKALPHVPYSFIFPFGAIVLEIARSFRRFNPSRMLVLGWAVAALIDVALPGKFWLHYFLLIMAPTSLLAGHFAAELHTIMGAEWRRLSAATVAVLVLLTCNPRGIYQDSMKARFFTYHDSPAVIAGIINEDLAPGEAIFVFNYQPVVYFLTDAVLPTSHVLPSDWSRRYTAVTGVDPLKEIDAVFRALPEYVIFIDDDWLKMGGNVLESLHRHLAVAYAKQFEIVDKQIQPQPVVVEVYRRRVDRGIAKGR